MVSARSPKRAWIGAARWARPCGASCTCRSRIAREACQDSAAAAAWSALTPRSAGEDAGRVGGDRPQHGLAVLVDSRSARAGPMWRRRGQVGDLPGPVGGVERQRAACLQLAPVASVLLPVAADFGPVAGAEVGDGADQRELLARLGLLHLEHRVAVVLGAEDDREHLDRAGEGGRIGIEEGGGVHCTEASGRAGGGRAAGRGRRTRAPAGAGSADRRGPARAAAEGEDRAARVGDRLPVDTAVAEAAVRSGHDLTLPRRADSPIR